MGIIKVSYDAADCACCGVLRITWQGLAVLRRTNNSVQWRHETERVEVARVLGLEPLNREYPTWTRSRDLKSWVT